ncbi:secA Wing and Scaffold domain protein [Mycobacterium ulcerans str. Harvey]|uniref:SecA Wing and Scaffold domain protein n=1 Tax=Mycobacterium ulcerans str. Harvey TaxID=1299332 RepID=A0ABP3AU68_MYCUL|nr:secA Wing and Scaffold domain protein [Mycobacterium ulcerans str. Harvey]
MVTGHQERPDPGRAAELRGAQERPQVRRGDEPAAQVIYAERRRILEGENLQQQVKDMLTDVITAYVDGATVEGYAEDWDLDALWTALKTLYPVGIKTDTLMRRDQDSDRDDLTRDELLEALLQDADQAYAAREAELEELAARARCASWNATCCSMSSTASGVSTSTRWTTSRRHRPARDGAARSAGRVPARRLRHVHGHARRRERGIGRIPVQRQCRGVPARRLRSSRRRARRPGEFATAAGRPRRGAGRKNAAAREEAPSRLRAKGLRTSRPL